MFNAVIKELPEKRRVEKKEFCFYGEAALGFVMYFSRLIASYNVGVAVLDCTSNGSLMRCFGDEVFVEYWDAFYTTDLSNVEEEYDILIRYCDYNNVVYDGEMYLFHSYTHICNSDVAQFLALNKDIKYTLVFACGDSGAYEAKRLAFSLGATSATCNGVVELGLDNLREFTYVAYTGSYMFELLTKRVVDFLEELVLKMGLEAIDENRLVVASTVF